MTKAIIKTENMSYTYAISILLFRILISRSKRVKERLSLTKMVLRRMDHIFTVMVFGTPTAG